VCWSLLLLLLPSQEMGYTSAEICSPEVAKCLLGRSKMLKSDPSMDMWALGCVLYQLTAHRCAGRPGEMRMPHARCTRVPACEYMYVHMYSQVRQFMVCVVCKWVSCATAVHTCVLHLMPVQHACFYLVVWSVPGCCRPLWLWVCC
jgi:hypothetical protein